jgi:hypothetical protein
MVDSKWSRNVLIFWIIQIGVCNKWLLNMLETKTNLCIHIPGDKCAWSDYYPGRCTTYIFIEHCVPQPYNHDREVVEENAVIFRSTGVFIWATEGNLAWLLAHPVFRQQCNHCRLPTEADSHIQVDRICLSDPLSEGDTAHISAAPFLSAITVGFTNWGWLSHIQVGRVCFINFLEGHTAISLASVHQQCREITVGFTNWADPVMVGH